MKYIYLTITLVCLVSCSKKQASDHDSDSTSSYPDGAYCAQVRYYYSATGTSSTYTLKIDVEAGELTRLYWPNGGWLDQSHFSTAAISDGHTRFTSDADVDYSVTVLGKEGECSLSSYATDEDNLVAGQERIDQERQSYENRQQERDQSYEDRKRQRDQSYENMMQQIDQDDEDQKKLFEQQNQEEAEEERKKQIEEQEEERERSLQAKEEEDPH